MLEPYVHRDLQILGYSPVACVNIAISLSKYLSVMIAQMNM